MADGSKAPKPVDDHSKREAALSPLPRKYHSNKNAHLPATGTSREVSVVVYTRIRSSRLTLADVLQERAPVAAPRPEPSRARDNNDPRGRYNIRPAARRHPLHSMPLSRARGSSARGTRPAARRHPRPAHRNGRPSLQSRRPDREMGSGRSRDALCRSIPRCVPRNGSRRIRVLETRRRTSSAVSTMLPPHNAGSSKNPDLHSPTARWERRRSDALEPIA